MDWYRFNIRKYRGDTHHLSALEHGAYRLLIDEYMASREPLPDNDKALARIACLSIEEWAEIAATIRAFFTPDAGKLTHDYCEDELAFQNGTTQKRSKAGKKAAAARLLKNKDNSTTAQQSSTTAQRLLNRGDIEETQKEKKESSPESSHQADRFTGGSAQKNGAHQNGTTAPATAGADLILLPKAPAPTPPRAQALDAWNNLARKHGLPTIAKLNAARTQKLDARLRQHGLEGWLRALDLVAASPFLLGQRNGPKNPNWRCTFDFLTGDTNFLKVLENAYGDRAQPPHLPKPRAPQGPPPKVP